MPSATFFNLPQAKRERLMSAARAEFCRAPYTETSINRMIRGAGIPRGSFYMYFDGKEDLFRYLMRTYGERLEGLILRLLEENGGDLFAAFLDLFDYVQDHWKQEQYQELIRILHQNGHLQPSVFFGDEGNSGFVQRLRDSIDLSTLDLRKEGDLCSICGLLVPVVGRAVIDAIHSGCVQENRARLVQLFDILKRGAAAKGAPGN